MQNDTTQTSTDAGIQEEPKVKSKHDGSDRRSAGKKKGTPGYKYTEAGNKKRKQLFCEHYARFHNITQAEKHAGMKPNVGYHLIRNDPAIRQRIQQWEQEYRRRSQATIEQLIDVAKKIIYTDGQTTSNKLKAAQFVAKISGAIEKDNPIVQRSYQIVIARKEQDKK